MTSSVDFFAEQGPELAPQPDRLEVVAGKVVATMNKPSAAQKRFNTLMARIDAEQALAGKLRQVLDTHGPRHRHALQEIHTQSQGLYKRMVETLDARIQAPDTPKGLAASQKQQAIRIVLSLCEQLASALHPDRAPDKAMRKRKTEWMSEVNAAYERKDLSVLLRIQLRSELVDAGRAAVLSDGKLKAMCDLLAEQVRGMEHVFDMDIKDVLHAMMRRR